ncbi:hypothetical protein BaRGS_00006990 [Batillaria attramentaria]|uniref:Transcriptional coactivator p15 (PC4) C-terminal domain-containing protein n=1 Tax=Batillaria attramentaria TaxID=370345 RepID=A0ABD0LPG3_9CAEN
MPKSKEYLSTSEESDSDNDAPKPKKKKVESGSDKAEKQKSSKEPKAKGGGSSSNSKAEKGPNGELMFPLARMRYATVSEFRGKKLVSIREYYEKDGQLLPGRKGISLTIDQWNALQDQMDDINHAVKTS